MKTNIKILEVCDRIGWALDRLSKPIAERYDDVDMSYHYISPDRFLASGYSQIQGATHYTPELAKGYDLIHFHRLESAVMGIEEVKARKVITIHTERHEDWEDERLLLFDDIIAPTKHAKEHFEKTFPNAKVKVYHVPHGIDTTRYKPQGQPKNREVGFVGRVVKWKRYATVQKAINMAGLKMVGCGYIEDTEEYTKNNLLEGTDYNYDIFMDERMMPIFFNQMNLLVCLSEPHIEAGPLPILEALACGTPVLSTRVGWAVDNCEHEKNIWFVDEERVANKDYPYVAEEIKKVYNNSSVREKLIEGGLELMKDFSIEKYTERVRKVYDNNK